MKKANYLKRAKKDTVDETSQREEVEPELPPSIHDKLGRLQRHATDHIIEVPPVSRYFSNSAYY